MSHYNSNSRQERLSEMIPAPRLWPNRQRPIVQAGCTAQGVVYGPYVPIDHTDMYEQYDQHTIAIITAFEEDKITAENKKELLAAVAKAVIAVNNTRA